MFFQNKKNQITRIKNKLKVVAQKDKSFSEFGSAIHKYRMKEILSETALAAWEKRNQVKLPACFAQFLTEVGNGGAGPYYGIYSLDKAEKYTESKALTLPCCLYPKMPKEEWNSLVKPLVTDEDDSDEDYDTARDKVLGGMLCIGTQGCEYDMYLVLAGQYTGRIVYTADFYIDSPFFFVYEDNFLDWYERWLDEIILDYNTSWFGYNMPGDEAQLIQVYQSAGDEEQKMEALKAMQKFNVISKTTLDFLKSVVEQKDTGFITAVQIICKLSLADGRAYVLEMMKSDKEEDFLEALRILKWYGKEANLDEFIPLILARKMHNAETLRFASYILHSQGKITLSFFEPYLRHADKEMRSNAIYATRDCIDKHDKINLIEQMLSDYHHDVLRNYMQFWGLVPHERLLPYYKTLWLKYKDNKNYRVLFDDCLKALNLPPNYFEL